MVTFPPLCLLIFCYFKVCYGLTIETWRWQTQRCVKYYYMKRSGCCSSCSFCLFEMEMIVTTVQIGSWSMTDRGAAKAGVAGLQPPPPNPSKPKFKKHRFCRYYDIQRFTWFALQPKSATEIGWWLVQLNFEKQIIKLKKQEDRIMWMSRGTCSYICMYINAAADSVMLDLQHDCITIFKIKHKLYIASGSPPPPLPPKWNFWVHAWNVTLVNHTHADGGLTVN
jgi:hypothetical protein